MAKEMHIKLPDDVHAALKRLAAARQRSMTGQLIFLVMQEADRLESWTVTGPTQEGHTK